MTSFRRRHLELVAIEGNPTEAERAAVERALEQSVREQRAAATPSMWLRAGRAQGRRLGMHVYRDRFSNSDAWRLSSRFPFGGREYSSKYGRGDSK